MSQLSVDVLHVKGDVDLNSLRPRNAVILNGSPGTAGQALTSQGPGRAPAWGAGGGTTTVPIGGMIMSVVAISDPNWLLCNGGSFSAVTYPLLNTFLGGTTLPDMRNLSPMGAGATVGLDATAGSTTNSLSTAQLAAHTHTGATHHHGSGGPHNHSYDEPVSAGAVGTAGTTLNELTVNAGASTGNTDPGNTADTTPGAGGSTGSGNSFSILSPVIGVNWYIRAA